jgi:hypothetical protein
VSYLVIGALSSIASIAGAVKWKKTTKDTAAREGKSEKQYAKEVLKEASRKLNEYEKANPEKKLSKKARESLKAELANDEHHTRTKDAIEKARNAEVIDDAIAQAKLEAEIRRHAQENESIKEKREEMDEGERSEIEEAREEIP